MDFRHLFANNELLKFWPSARQTASQRIYATTRFIIYATVIIYILKKDVRIFALAALVLGILYVLSRSGMIQEGRAQMVTSDGRGGRGVTLPTFDNPMANILISDIGDHPDRPAAAYYPTVKQEVADQWGIIHPFEKRADAERNFYTVAATTIPNDRDAFTNFLYGDPKAPSCRDTPGVCDPDNNSRNIERVQQRAVFNRTTQMDPFLM